jgi:hypothetical protein
VLENATFIVSANDTHLGLRWLNGDVASVEKMLENPEGNFSIAYNKEVFMLLWHEMSKMYPPKN